jgi:hypothetical protein
MKHVTVTLLVCLDVTAFAALYQRTTGMVVHAISEGLSQISVSGESSVP